MQRRQINRDTNSCIVNRKMRVGNSKYVAAVNPISIDHVMHHMRKPKLGVIIRPNEAKTSKHDSPQVSTYNKIYEINPQGTQG